MKVRISKIRTWFWWLLVIFFIIGSLFDMIVKDDLLNDYSKTTKWVVGILYSAFWIVCIFYLGMAWHCPGCKRHTFIMAPYCLRCGTELNPDDTTDVV